MPKIIKQVIDFPGYWIETNGKMWSSWKTRGNVDGSKGAESYISDKMKELKPRRHNKGYLTIALRKEGKYHYFLIHRLVLLTFVGPCPEGMECLHGDGDKTNNDLFNLSWGTHQGNMDDMLRHGRTTKGEKDAAAKLTDELVLQIVKMLVDEVPQTEIAELMGVSQACISFIAKGKTWTHITNAFLSQSRGGRNQRQLKPQGRSSRIVLKP